MPARWWNGGGGGWRDYELPFLFCCPCCGSEQLECLPPVSADQNQLDRALVFERSQREPFVPLFFQAPMWVLPNTFDIRLSHAIIPPLATFSHVLSTMRLMAMPHLVHIHQYETAWGLQCPSAAAALIMSKEPPKHPPPNVVSLSSLPSQIDGSRLLQQETPARITGSLRSSFHLLS